jgi:chromate transporter
MQEKEMKAESDPGSPTPSPSPVRLRDLFVGFLGLGLTSFGGALPLARRGIVERRGWLSAEEFTELLGLCQFLPGGNVMNLSAAIGMRFCGVTGACVALLAFVGGPALVVVGLGVIYERTQDSPHVRHFFAGLGAAAAGLLIATTIKLAQPLRGRPAALFIMLIACLAIAVLRAPLVPTMLILTPISIFIASRTLR